MKDIEMKVRVKLSEAIEKAMDDDKLVDELDMYFPDDYSVRMADAALAVLLGMRDTYEYFKDEELLK
jgi:hypothetical protein